MLIRNGLSYLCLTVWLLDVKVEAYRIGCIGGYCFVLLDINSNYDQYNAQQRCQSNGTQLVEIISKSIQNSLISFIKDINTNNWSYFLTNGKRSSDSSWSRLTGIGIGDTTVYDQPDASYAYGYLKSTTKGLDLFASQPTYNKEGFICTNLSDCSGGATINGMCYRSFSETLSWYDARNRCLDGGGDLATFDHITTNAGFNALNGSWLSTSIGYWIGIRRESWTWQSSRTDVKYTNWLSGHPVNDVSRSNTECLCVSTTQWKWIECDCNQQLPFVCFSKDPATSNTPATSTKATSTTSPAFTSSSTISKDSVVALPTIPLTVTTKFPPDANNTENALSRDASIGIGVGVGVGGGLVIIALVVVAAILYMKRCPLRYPEKNPTNAKIHPPDIIMRGFPNADHSSYGIENPYALVVSSSPESEKADTNGYENFSQSPTDYAQLAFCRELQIHRDAIGSVTIVPGKTRPNSPVSSQSQTDITTNHFNVNGDLYAEVTKA